MVLQPLLFLSGRAPLCTMLGAREGLKAGFGLALSSEARGVETEADGFEPADFVAKSGRFLEFQVARGLDHAVF